MSEKYQHFLSTGSGSTKIDLSLNDDASVISEIVSNWMGLGKHSYELSGAYKAFSPAHGWILIDTVKHQFTSDNQEREEKLSCTIISKKEIIIEYFKISSSPYLEHPSELGSMQQMGYANWNETFELLLILQNSDHAYLEAIHEDDYVAWGEDAEKSSDKAQVETLVHALLLLDKTKYSRQIG